MSSLSNSDLLMPSSECWKLDGFSNEGVELVRHINIVLHKSHDGLEFS